MDQRRETACAEKASKLLAGYPMGFQNTLREAHGCGEHVYVLHAQAFPLVDAFNASYGLICCELATQLRPRCDHCHYCSGQRRAARKCSGGTSTVQLQSEQPIHIGTAHTVPRCLDSVFCSSTLVRSHFVPASLSFEANLATGVPRFNALMDQRPAEFPHQAVDPRQKRGLRCAGLRCALLEGPTEIARPLAFSLADPKAIPKPIRRAV